MKLTDREQARRLGAYVDEIVRARRADGDSADRLSDDDREFEALAEIARHLNDGRIQPPDGFGDALLSRLRAGELPARSSWRQQVRAVLSLPRAAAAAAVVVAGVLWFAPAAMDLPVVSAQSVLHRSDTALTDLAGPGEVLYRKWRVTSSGGPAMMTGTALPGRIIEEWMDGSDPNRVAARWYTLDGDLQVAYTTVSEQDGSQRPHVYFTPGLYGEQAGLLNLEPTREEFSQALGEFPPQVARALRVYLDRHYIYAPIKGEREYNHAIFAPAAGAVPELPRVLVSHDSASRLAGEPVYRVRLVDAAAVTFNWRGEGASEVRIGQAEITRYISQGTFLTLRTEERIVYPGGRQRESVKEVVATEVLPLGSLSTNPFVLDVPASTPVRRQSAREHLASVAAALVGADSTSPTQ